MSKRTIGSAFLYLLIAAILTVPQSLAAQQTQFATPDWVFRYFQAEPRGQKFGHAWIQKTERLRALRTAARTKLPGPPPGRHNLHGTFATVILAGTYSDVDPKYTPQEYHDAFFANSGQGGRYTLNQFYREASGGMFGFDGMVTPWIRLDKSRAYYIDGFSNAGRGRFEEYLRAVLVQADTMIDWRLYDNDGPDGMPNSGDDDGYVDMVIFLHPLADGVCRGDRLGGPVATGFRLEYLSQFNFEPYATSINGANGTPIKVNDFVLTAGLACDGSSIASMNIPIHEMGHALGLPDLYDRDFSSYGVGVWDVMGYGLYAAAGRPAMFGAWSRRQLGWAHTQTITVDTALTLEPTITSREIYMVEIPETNEFFLLENRQRVSADAGLPGTGLILWHVNNDVLQSRLNSYAVVNNEERPGLAVIQADGNYDLANKANQGDAGDPFPGSTGNTEISDSTQPNTRSTSGTPSGIHLKNISEEDTAVTVEIAFGSTIFIPVQELPVARLGQVNYSATLQASGGVGTLTWTADNAVPEWLDIRSNGTVYAVPPALGQFTFHFTVTDQLGFQATGTATINVVMPALTTSAAVNALLDVGNLTDIQNRALDLLGNGNGRLDVGDVLQLRLLEAGEKQ